MTPKEVKEKGKRLCRSKFLLFYLGFFILLILLINLLAFAAAASGDVAYVYKSKLAVDNNIVSVFNNLGLSVDLIDEKNAKTTDFSKYKLIFAGDERFRYANNIPVNDYPSIIANYYFGQQWGLTDGDGISKLASSFPMSVRLVDNGIVQVYTQAKFNNKPVSIPYYYLDDENKASGMQKQAGTYTGNEYDFGDVISYANAGTHLINGKSASGKICFFGIIESDYWTPAAKEMFEDCVAFVAMTCSSDSDCADEEIGNKYCQGDDVYQDVKEFQCENPGTVHSQCVDDIVSEKIEECDYACFQGECIRCNENSDCNDNNANTADMCLNPGTLASSCSNEGITCSSDSGCGTDGFTGDLFCINNSSYQDYITFNCLNPGTSQSRCENSTSQVLKQNCNLCIGGQCVECLEDSDCPDDFFEAPYCSNNNVFNYFTDYSCVNYQCSFERTANLNKTCAADELCVSGECRKIECYDNYDCGANGFLSGLYCINGNSNQDFQSFVCKHPGTLNSYCMNYTLPILMDYCEFQCISGDCISCFNNLSCGNNSFIGNKYCIDNSIYQNYKQFECLNPGTKDSDCLSSISEKLIEDCLQGEVCVLGECRKVTCYNDADCDDSNVHTIDECNHPGTTSSYCTNTPINCVTNNDCGITGFTGTEFCSQEDVFKNYQNSTCINGGTKQSYCDVSSSQLLLIDCGIDSCTTWGDNYCKGKDLYHSRNCFDKGCSNGACFSQTTAEEELVQICEFGCSLGVCLPECTVNSDCGMQSSELICIGKNITNKTITPTCNNGGCENITSYEFVDECLYGCLDGSCISECIDDSDCSSDFNNPEYCFLDDVYHEVHDFSCLTGSCNENIFPELVEDCGVDSCEAWQDNYCIGDDVYRNRTCYDKGCSDITDDCFNNPSQEEELVEECAYGCVNGVCLNDTRIHDVALIGFTDSVGGIGLEYLNGTSILQAKPLLICNDIIKAKVKIENQGNYTENVIMIGNLNANPFLLNNINNFVAGDTTYRTSLTPYISLIGLEGNYTITAEAIIPIDNDPLDNFASREIEIICPKCFLDSDCPDDIISGNYCIGKNVTRNITEYFCISGECIDETTSELVEECEQGCEDGSCVNITCYSNSDCLGVSLEYFCSGDERWFTAGTSYCVNPGTSQSRCEMDYNDFFDKDCGSNYCDSWDNNYCIGDDVYRNRTCYDKGCSDITDDCFNNPSQEEELVEECAYGCVNGECIESDCDMISYWKFDETSGDNAKDSIDSNDGSVLEGEWDSSGKVENSLEFQGSGSYVDVPNNQNLWLNGSFSVAAWIKPEKTRTKSIIAKTFLNKQGNVFWPHNYYEIFIDSGRKITFWYGENCNWGTDNGGICHGSCYKWGTSDTRIDADKWQHVIVTFNQDTKTITYYLNGVSDGSSTKECYVMNPEYQASPFFIGSTGYSPKDFDGLMDEVAIWGRALSESEVQQFYDRSSNGQPYCNIP